MRQSAGLASQVFVGARLFSWLVSSACAKPTIQSRRYPEDISLQFGPAALAEEIETWRDVYGIDERYKAKVLGENDGKYWITQVLDEWKEKGRQPADFLKDLARQAEKKPFAEANFLKKPFLEACQAKGLFTVADQIP